MTNSNDSLIIFFLGFLTGWIGLFAIYSKINPELARGLLETAQERLVHKCKSRCRRIYKRLSKGIKKPSDKELDILFIVIVVLYAINVIVMMHRFYIDISYNNITGERTVFHSYTDLTAGLIATVFLLIWFHFKRT